MEHYLGSPMAVGRITSGTFDHINERGRAKMNGWSEKNMACAGREVLLKSVIQAIPTHSMSCFLLTKKVCKNPSTTNPVVRLCQEKQNIKSQFPPLPTPMYFPIIASTSPAVSTKAVKVDSVAKSCIIVIAYQVLLICLQILICCPKLVISYLRHTV